MKAPLVKRLAGAIDVRATGLSFAAIALIGVTLTLGAAPTALAIGLLALCLVD